MRNRSNLSGWLILAASLALILEAPSSSQASSYLDFLPTARIALNKLQQSLAPALPLGPIVTSDLAAQNTSPSETPTTTTLTEVPPPTTTSTEATTVAAATAAASSESFDRVEEATSPPSTERPAPPEASTSEAATEAATETITGANSLPTLGPVSSEAPVSSPAPVEQVVTVDAAELPASTERASSPSGEVSVKVDEASIRETELEAVAAVDESIGFGGDPFNPLSDACYDEYGNARYCEPEFENVAFERTVEVSSECGTPPSRFCTAYPNERNEQIRNCHICDAQHPKKRHPAAYLTDMNSGSQPTCWVSAPILSAPYATDLTANSSNDKDLEPIHRDNVTLRLNFDKKYEIVYISMQFCSLKPDSLAIYKSADFGKTWEPYQFYSSQCRRLYERTARSSSGPVSGQTSDGRPTLEASCTNANGNSPAPVQGGQSAGRIAFSTLDGPLDKSVQLHDWITATNIKLVLDRHQANWIHSTAANLNHQSHGRHQPPTTAANGTERPAGSAPQEPQQQALTQPSDTFNYAMSDLTIGGRCKCNGHASRCIHNRDGSLQCDCRHNTAGPDCDRCAPFHFDRPWSWATPSDANPCQPCNCNGHSRKCQFDPVLYRMSGKRSGGVCLSCRDHTAGRHCDYCEEGYYRDQSKPMSDKNACKHCDCHPIGSTGKVCNRTTGQCPCKEGVSGLQCNRCAPGYQQSSSLSEPCIKLLDSENDINYDPPLVVDGAEGNSAATSPPQPADSYDEPDRQQQTDTRQPPVAKAEDEMASRRPPARVWPKDESWARGPPATPFEASLASDGEPALDEETYTRQLAAKNFMAGYNAAKKRFRIRPSIYGRRPASIGSSELDGAWSPFEDEMSSALDESMDQLTGYSDLPPSVVDDQTFNQIPWPAMPPQTSARRPHQSHHLVQQANGRNKATHYRAGPTNPTNRQRPLKAAALDRSRTAASNELTCGDCQSKTRRLLTRQFCHLSYAIRATILSKLAAEDWTKFEVEVQDKFKSPMGQTYGPAQASGLRQAHANADNLLLADEPAPTNSSNSSSELDAVQGPELSVSGSQQPQHPSHILVGSKHWIWVPTEDLNCRCPRLKMRSTYLLMGTVDTTSGVLQLDRHGVALEWRSKLQGKMISLQQKEAEGRCQNVAQ